MKTVYRSGFVTVASSTGELDVDCGKGEVFVVSGERNHAPYEARRPGAVVSLVGIVRECEPDRRTVWHAFAPFETVPSQKTVDDLCECVAGLFGAMHRAGAFVPLEVVKWALPFIDGKTRSPVSAWQDAVETMTGTRPNVGAPKTKAAS